MADTELKAPAPAAPPEGRSPRRGAPPVESDRELNSVDDALAELERRRGERKAEKKAKDARKAAAEAKRSQPEPEDDETDGEGDETDARKAEPKAKKPAKAAKAAKAEEADEDEDTDSDGEDADEVDDGSADDEDAAADDDSDETEGEEDKAATADADDDTEEVEYEGEQYRVPSKLKDALLRQSDYTRKTQELQAERQHAQQSFQQVQAVAQQLAQQHTMLQQYAQAMLGTPPSLELLQSDPNAYMVQKGLHEQRQEVVKQLQQQSQEAQQRVAQLQQRQVQQHMAEHLQALVKAEPALKDPAKREAFSRDVQAGAAAFGFTAQDVAQIHDHRTLLMLRWIGTTTASEAARTKAATDVKHALAKVPPKQAKPAASTMQPNKSLKAQKAKRDFMNSSRSDRDIRAYLRARDG